MCPPVVVGLVLFVSEVFVSCFLFCHVAGVGICGLTITWKQRRERVLCCVVCCVHMKVYSGADQID